MKVETSESTPTKLNTFFFISVFVGLLLVGGCALFAPSPKITHHLDDLVVMDIPAIQNYERSFWGQIRICRTFYQSYDDDFDVILILSNIPWGSEQLNALRIHGRMKLVRNSVQGTGIRRFDSGKLHGSPSKLKGILDLPTHHALLLGYSLHELAHLWVVNHRVIPTTSKHHWGFSSVNGVLGGFDRTTLVELGNDQFLAAPFMPNRGYPMSNKKPYSELELYLSGFIPIEEVPDIWVAEDGRFSRDPDGVIEKDENGNFVFQAKRISIWRNEEIVKKLGPRVPNHEDSQKSIRLAVIAINNSSNPLEDKDIAYVRKAIELFTLNEGIKHLDKITIKSSGHTHNWSFEPGLYNFWDATGGRGMIDAHIASERKETQETAPNVEN